MSAFAAFHFRLFADSRQLLPQESSYRRPVTAWLHCIAPSCVRGRAIPGFGGSFGLDCFWRDHDECLEMSFLPFNACIFRNHFLLRKRTVRFRQWQLHMIRNDVACEIRRRIVFMKVIRAFYRFCKMSGHQSANNIYLSPEASVTCRHESRSPAAGRGAVPSLHPRAPASPDAQQPQLSAGTNIRYGCGSHRRTGHQSRLVSVGMDARLLSASVGTASPMEVEIGDRSGRHESGPRVRRKQPRS